MLQPTHPRDFLTPKEAASQFKVNIRIFYSWLRDGTGPAHIRKGRIIRIPVEAFNKWTKPSAKGK